MNTIETILLVISIAFVTVLQFLVLKDGFHWKIKYALLVAPFGVILMPILMFIAWSYIIGTFCASMSEKCMNYLIDKFAY